MCLCVIYYHGLQTPRDYCKGWASGVAASFFCACVCACVCVFFLIMDYGCRENIAGAEGVASQLGKIS